MGAHLFGKRGADGKWEGGEFGDEMREEVTQQLAMMAYGAWRSYLHTAIGDAFMSLRRWVKTDNSVFATKMREFLVSRMGQETFDKWGKEQMQPWTIAGQITKQIEAIPDENMKEFVEEFWEEFGELFRSFFCAHQFKIA